MLDINQRQIVFRLGKQYLVTTTNRVVVPEKVRWKKRDWLNRGNEFQNKPTFDKKPLMATLTDKFAPVPCFGKFLVKDCLKIEVDSLHFQSIKIPKIVRCEKNLIVKQQFKSDLEGWGQSCNVRKRCLGLLRDVHAKGTFSQCCPIRFPILK